MRKIRFVLICAACLFFVASTVTAQDVKKAMTNADVVEMVKAGLSEEIIITSIRQAPAKEFDLTPTGLIALKKAGVSDGIIKVLQDLTTVPKSTTETNTNNPASDEREVVLNAVLKQVVTNPSRGALSLSSFQKTNGYIQDSTQNLYVLEWQAEILWEQAGYKAGDIFVGYWQDFSVLQQKPGTLDSLVVGNTIPFQKGTRVRLWGDSLFRRTEKGWRLEKYTAQRSQVLAEKVPVKTPTNSISTTSTENPTSARSLETLSATIDKGEGVIFEIKYYSSGNFLTGAPGMRDGRLIISKTAVVFQPTTGDKGFSISPDKFLELVCEKSIRCRLKAAIPNKKGDKEDKKEFDFYHPSTEINGAQFSCPGCDQSMSLLFGLLQKVRGNEVDTSVGNEVDAKVKEELLFIERQLGQAQIAGDKTTFDKLLTDDFILIQDGKTFKKSWFLENMKPLKGMTFDIENPKLSLEGETATLTGVAVMSYPNKSKIRYKFTDKFVKREGQWRMITAVYQKYDAIIM